MRIQAQFARQDQRRKISLAVVAFSSANRYPPRRSFAGQAFAGKCSSATGVGAKRLIFVAVDIGGTFTDLLGFDDEAQVFMQAKSLSTPADLVQGIINCIRESGAKVGAIDELIHGSTIAINTLIERKGARTGLVVTRGTRDVYIIGRGNRPESYNLFFHRHRPLVSRRLTMEAAERVLSSGEVDTPLAKGERGGGLQGAQGRRGRGGRGLLPARLRQSRARARRRRHDQKGDAQRLSFSVARNPARVSRVRAHVHDGGECLYRPQGRRLREEPKRASARLGSAAISRSCARTEA